MNIPRLQRLRKVPVYMQVQEDGAARAKPKRETKMWRVLNVLEEEGGRWTSVGIGEVIGMPSREVSKILASLAERNLVRKVDMQAARGHLIWVYEAAE